MNKFYPSLFEVEEQDIETYKEDSASSDEFAESKELRQAQMAGILGKYVAASPAKNLILDPNTFEIISVNKKLRDTPISSWEEVRLFPSGKSTSKVHREKLIKYIQYE